MSKKKKKKQPKPTLTQKTAACFKSGAIRARQAAVRIREDAPKAAALLYKKTDAFIRYKWSAAPIALVMLALMLFSYSYTRYHYLFGNFPMYATRITQLYLIDYRVGFVSRALVGHVISLFTDKVSMALIVHLTHAALWISLILQAGLAAMAFKKAWLNKNGLLCALFLLFALSHHTVIPNVINFGVLDTYNLILVCFYIYLSDTKAGKWLAPLVCFTGIILHYEFVLAYLTLVLSVELYYIVQKRRGRGLRIFLFCLTVLGSAALTVYLTFFSKSHVKMTAEELAALMRAKFTDARTAGVFDEYFTYYIYGDYQGVNYSAPADFVKFLVAYALERIEPLSHVLYALSTFPVFGIFVYFWIYILKQKPKAERLPYLVFMLQPLMLALAMTVSTDTSRWAGAAWFSNYMLLYTVWKNETPLLDAAARAAVNRPWKKAAAAIVILGAYACVAYIYTSQ